MQTNYNDNSKVFSADYNRFFLQLSIGFKSQYFEGIFFLRTSQVTVDNIQWLGDERNEKSYFGNLTEVGFTVKGGFKHFKINMQTAGAVPNETITRVFDYNSVGSKLQLGITTSFNMGDLFSTQNNNTKSN